MHDCQSVPELRPQKHFWYILAQETCLVATIFVGPKATFGPTEPPPLPLNISTIPMTQSDRGRGKLLSLGCACHAHSSVFDRNLRQAVSEQWM